MTASVVSPGGAPPAGASASPRAKGSPATADHAFAQVLAGIGLGDDAADGTGEGRGPAADPLAAWSHPGRLMDADSTPPEPAVPIDVVRPRDTWTTLAMAWTAASDVASVGVADEPGAASATDRSQTAPQVGGAPSATTVEPLDAAQPDVALPAAAPVSVDSADSADATPADAKQTMSTASAAGRAGQGPEPRFVRTSSVAEAADVSSAPPSDASPADTAQTSTGVKAPPGSPTTSTPSNELPASSTQVSAPRGSERHELAHEALAEAPLSAASSVAAEQPSTMAAITDTPVAATPGREPDRVPSLPDAQAAVGVQSSFRATPDVAPSTGLDAAAPATADTATAVVDQVVKSMRLQWKNGLGEARIQLRPEHLGPVDISIKVDGGAITAVVRAESSQVQEWILSHQQSLRQQLEAAGLRLEALVVSPDAERRRQGDQAEARQQAASRRRRHDGHAPVFEVIV